MDEVPDPYNIWVTCSVNGEQRMRVNTSDQIWKLPDIIPHFSRLLDLQPGDMFSTGAPGGVAVGKANAESLYVKPGDVIDMRIRGAAHDSAQPHRCTVTGDDEAAKKRPAGRFFCATGP